jgi:hypothetical protein
MFMRKTAVRVEILQLQTILLYVQTLSAHHTLLQNCIRSRTWNEN